MPGELLLGLISDAGVPLVRTWMATLRHRVVEGARDAEVHRRYGPIIWAFWHGQIFGACFVGRDRGIRILISYHRDGEYVATVAAGFGYDVVRGSTTRGGTEALEEMARTAGRRDLAITPDGPRGPGRIVQPGAILLAAITGRPIVPIGIGASPCTHLHNWDRFVIPAPFAAVGVVIGEPIFVPPGAGRDAREQSRLNLENTLNRLTSEAEAVARGEAPRPYPCHHYRYGAGKRPGRANSV